MVGLLKLFYEHKVACTVHVSLDMELKSDLCLLGTNFNIWSPVMRETVHN